MHAEKDALHQLSSIFARVRTTEEIQVLLAGLLTPQEVEEVVLRWRLMAGLLRGQTQRDIAKTLGVSLGKIARGSRLLKYDLPEFAALVEKLEATGSEPR